MSKWQQSECKGGWLHNYKLVKNVKNGVVERCSRCKKQMYFPNNVPNPTYLSFHLRSALQKNDPRFTREYPNIA